MVLFPFSKSQILMVRSWDPVSRLLVTKLNLQALIVSLWPGKVWTVRMVLSFHKTALCSVDAAARYSLSIEIDTSVMALVKMEIIFLVLTEEFGGEESSKYSWGLIAKVMWRYKILGKKIFIGYLKEYFV